MDLKILYFCAHCWRKVPIPLIRFSKVRLTKRSQVYLEIDTDTWSKCREHTLNYCRRSQVLRVIQKVTSVLTSRKKVTSLHVQMASDLQIVSLSDFPFETKRSLSPGPSPDAAGKAVFHEVLTSWFSKQTSLMSARRKVPTGFHRNALGANDLLSCFLWPEPHSFSSRTALLVHIRKKKNGWMKLGPGTLGPMVGNWFHPQKHGCSWAQSLSFPTLAPAWGYLVGYLRRLDMGGDSQKRSSLWLL